MLGVEDHNVDGAPVDLETQKRELSVHLANRKPESLHAVLPVLNAHPTDAELLVMAVTAALLDELPQPALRYLHRFTKRFVPFAAEHHLLRAIALAQQGLWTQAAQIVKHHGAPALYSSIQYMPCGWALLSWYRDWLRKIERAEQRRAAPVPKPAKSPRPGGRHSPAEKTPPVVTARTPVRQPAAAVPASEAPGAPPPLRRYAAEVPFSLYLPDALDETLTATHDSNDCQDLGAFRLRYEWMHLGLLQGFDELLCLPTLHGVETYWYQVEAVRKVLKQFRGRVLLADEVGLGKTMQAGMVLKEYLLRSMVERVLILTPATLVGQWQEEMTTKFDMPFATSYDALLRQAPPAFWAQPRVIASLATARRPDHHAILAQQPYDLVIVDEAQHLKNRATANWKLVNALQKRFLLLLSATPVQNSLIELYNLLTLLKPGIFQTEKVFRASYMMSGKPRLPANRERLRDLMRDVMIRNTRALVDVHLPPRHATTLRLEPTEEEAACYQELSRLVQEAHRHGSTQQRLALHHLLSAAGSTAATAAAALRRYIDARPVEAAWHTLHARYAALPETGKEQALLTLLRRNPDEKKIVFVHHRDTLARLAHLLDQATMPYALFEGAMSGPEKDRAITRFRDAVPLLLCTESGGEGRNLQFCNTLINFDLPWNPMAIEQRIGRLHRIGQQREVFIFNLVVRDTLEEHILRLLDEKINMFELVVGEIDAILGEMHDAPDFAELVFQAWIETTAATRDAAFAELGQRLVDAKSQYEAAKALDEELFGTEFVAG